MKKPAIFTIVMLLIISIFSTGCAAAKIPEATNQKSFAIEAGAAPIAPEQPMPQAERNVDINVSTNAVERIVIKNADLSIVVKDPAASMNAIGTLAEGMGGFIVSSQLYKTRTEEGVEVPVADITVRIPAERLTEAMDQIKSYVADPQKDVLSENVSGQDVTKEYTDLQSRLKNLQNAEAQLDKILQEATKTEDVLNVYRELTNVQEQIEVIKGQIKYYDEASQLSALRVKIQSLESVKPLTIGGWQPVGVARDALQALINALKYLANTAIWIVIFCLPVSILVGIPGWLIIRTGRRWWLKRKRNKQTEAPAKADK